MKKLIFILCTVFAVSCFLPFACAEDTVPAGEEGGTAAETEMTENAEESTVGLPAETNEENYGEYAEMFAKYVFSGTEDSSEIMDRLILICEEYQASKEAGYTFKERISQLITPENIIVTSAAAFLVVCGIAFFAFESKRKKDRRDTYSDVKRLKDMYADESESNKALREMLEKQNTEISEMKAVLTALSEKSDISRTELDRTAHSSEAVAKMVKDVFLSSKTIDASGKALLVHNYLDTLGSDTGEEKNEQ